MASRRRRLILLFGLALAAALRPASGQLVHTTWIGPPNGYWLTADNWSGGVVPNNTGSTQFAVHIDGGPVRLSFTHLTPPLAVNSIDLSGGTLSSYSSDLRVLNALSVDGVLEVGGSSTAMLATGATLSGTGTVVLDGGAHIAEFFADGGDLIVPPSLTIIGRDTAFYGGWLGTAGQPTANHGTIVANGLLSLRGSSFVNFGSVRAEGPGAGLHFGFDSWRIEDISTVTRTAGAMFTIGGTLDNTGRTFNVDANSGTWTIAGTVRGGTISVADGYVLRPMLYGWWGLDNVFVHGAMAAGAAARVTLHDGVLRGDGSVAFGGPVVEGPSRLVSATDSIRIDDGMTARFQGIYQYDFPPESNSGIGDPDNRKPIRIDGTAAVSGNRPYWEDRPVEFLMFGNVINSGVIEQGLYARWRIAGDVTSLADSTLRFELQTEDGRSHHPMMIEGRLDLTALGDRVEIIAPPGLEFGRTFILAETGGPVVYGTVDSFTLGFVVYSFNHQLLARVVPEPQATLGVALAGLLHRRRRRRVGVGRGFG